MGQKPSTRRPYGAGGNRKSAWTALACGAALMSDGILLSPLSLPGLPMSLFQRY